MRHSTISFRDTDIQSHRQASKSQGRHQISRREGRKTVGRKKNPQATEDTVHSCRPCHPYHWIYLQQGSTKLQSKMWLHSHRRRCRATPECHCLSDRRCPSLLTWLKIPLINATVKGIYSISSPFIMLFWRREAEISKFEYSPAQRTRDRTCDFQLVGQAPLPLGFWFPPTCSATHNFRAKYRYQIMSKTTALSLIKYQASRSSFVFQFKYFTFLGGWKCVFNHLPCLLLMKIK